jgi:exonuclease III
MWNINGLQSAKNDKLCDEIFINSLNKCDILGLVETHTSESTPITITGYKAIQVDRPRSRGAKSDSGGILIKEMILDGIKTLANTSKHFQWIMLKKEFFDLDEDLYICFTHIPPIRSSYTEKNGDDTLDDIERDIQKFSTQGKILLCGDLNARSGEKPDYILNEQNDDLFLPLDTEYI